MTGLSNKDILQDILTTEKHGISSYSSGITESSCNNLRDTLVGNLKSSEEVQYKVFDAMRQKGWYTIKDAPESEIQELKNSSNTLMNEIQ
ncbi:spore coat protein [Clostridium sp. 19966]|uniref:spore coat protein n=1 Tax=Clostridium sp. 19966 TaxID=2768166 RepID=UPI0028DE4704|nr:spore coat protein [Clostridium sp. 19966]MDT8716366.1 spore coat protein [Clostridium sp. 19966]